MGSAQTDAYKALLKTLVSTRRRAGLTQQRLANRLRKPQSFVSKYESGERRLDVIEYVTIIRAMNEDPISMLSQFLAARRRR